MHRGPIPFFRRPTQLRREQFHSRRDPFAPHRTCSQSTDSEINAAESSSFLI